MTEDNLAKVEKCLERYGWAMADHSAHSGEQSSQDFKNALQFRQECLTAVEQYGAQEKGKGKLEVLKEVFAKEILSAEALYPETAAQLKALREQYEQEAGQREEASDDGG